MDEGHDCHSFAMLRGDGTALMSRGDFAAWLQRKIAERTPAAAIRFGDGEARVLTIDVDDPEAMDDTARALKRESGLSFSPAEVGEIKELLTLAFEKADVLGIRTSRRVLPEQKKWMDRLADLYEDRVASGGRPAALAHCLLSYQVLDDALPELLGGNRVSVISCRDLRPILEGEWGLADVGIYQVPSQYTARDVDGTYEAVMHETPIWPDAHVRVREELTVREPGEVFLVGAGLFGKDLCIHVRDHGGIALDMGSALDRVAGKVTRGPKRRVLDLHAEGMPVEQVVSHLRHFYGAGNDEGDLPQVVADAMHHADTELAVWRTRRLAAEYPIVRIDKVEVEIEGLSTQGRTCHVAVGIGHDGSRDPLGIWWVDSAQEADPTGAILDDLRRRGVHRLSLACEPIETCSAIHSSIKAHGPFHDEEDAARLIHLALSRAEAKLRKHPLSG